MLGWSYEVQSNPGARPYQEDSYAALERPAHAPDELLLVLADGMGGARGGARASRLAVRQFIDNYQQGATATIPERLWGALSASNQALARAVAGAPRALAGMGCTVLAVVISSAGVYWISVGDSPLWLWRKSGLVRLNQDHSYRTLLARQIASGKLSPAQAACHPQRNALLSAVTGEPLERVDLAMRPYPLEAGDKVLLASDGVLTLTETQIASVLGAPESFLCQRLVAAVLAEHEEHQDNVTVVLAQLAPRLAA